MDQRAKPFYVKPGDQMYLDVSSQHSPTCAVQAGQWMHGTVRSVDIPGPSVHLDLQPALGKISPWVNARCLKLFEQRDADFTDLESPVIQVFGGDDTLHYRRTMIRLR